VAGLRRFLWLWVPAVLGLAGCTVAEVPPQDSGSDSAEAGRPETEIPSMLQASAASWNAGDLEGFLDDYWRSDTLTFSGSTGVTRGWVDVRERYLRTYWAPGVARDSLRFEELEVMPLGSDHALTLGRYALYRPEAGDSVTSTGYFSLVLRRGEGGWKILHDHTSSAPPAGAGG